MTRSGWVMPLAGDPIRAGWRSLKRLWVPHAGWSNVGAGTGSSEPKGSAVIAVEPSEAMLPQRAPGLVPVLRARAEQLPLGEHAVDLAMAVLTVHHWSAWRRGLDELRRVAHRQVVVAYDPRMHCDFWLVREYIPKVADLELRWTSAADISDALHPSSVITLPVPWDFIDGVLPAYWRRSAAYLTSRFVAAVLRWRKPPSSRCAGHRPPSRRS